MFGEYESDLPPVNKAVARWQQKVGIVQLTRTADLGQKTFDCAGDACALTRSRSSGCFRGTNWRCRYDHLDKSGRNLINEA